MINSIIRKVVLLLCLAFAVVAFGFPCFVVPFGSYDGEVLKVVDGVEQIDYKYSYSFSFNGKAKYVKTSATNKNEILEEKEYYYKLKRNKVYLSEDKNVDANDEMITIASVIRLGNGAFNIYSCAVSIGIAVIAGALIITAPNKKY